MEKIGLNIKKYRVNKGLSQEELAKEINVTRQAVSKWERLESLPDIENVILLSELFEITLDEFLGRKKTNKMKKIQSKLSYTSLGIQITGLIIFVIAALLIFTNNIEIYFLGDNSYLSEMTTSNIAILSVMLIVFFILIVVGVVFIILFMKNYQNDNLNKMYVYAIIVLFVSQPAGILLLLAYNKKKTILSDLM